MTINYYQIGGALPPDSPYYVTRKADKELFNYLVKGEFCYVFNARQMGKTSLQFQVSKKLHQQGFIVVNLDLSSIGNSLTIEQWYATIISKIYRSLNLTFNLSSWWKKQELLSFSSRWEVFLKDILLEKIKTRIVIFIDEIDTVLNLDFSTDDFFASIRACFNNRAKNDNFNRLTFCLLGVTRPYHLIQDKQRTPFNIGKAIELQGFTFQEVEITLIKGLDSYFKKPKEILKEILSWTGGQPFLTVKICQLMVDCYQKISQNKLSTEQLIRENIIKNWRANDDPIHLQIIENRIVNNSHSVIELLILYQQILKSRFIFNQDTYQQYELRLSGLIIKTNNSLQVYNKIYRTIFDETWIAEKIQEQLSKVRPDFYVVAFQKWATSESNKSRYFLSPQEVQEFEKWASKGQELTKEDLKFLHYSVKKHERQERNKKDRLKFIFSSLLIFLISSFLAIQWYQSNRQYQEQLSRNLMLSAKKIEQDNLEAKIILQIEGLRRNDNLPIPLDFYRDLAKIAKNHRVFFHENQVNDVAISQNGKRILTGGLDGNAYLWDINGQLIHKLHHDNYSINTVAFSGDNNYFATASIDGNVKVWHQNGKLKLTFKHGSSVNKIAFSPDHNYLATVGADYKIKLLHLNQKKITSLVHKGNILSLAFSSIDPYLITGSLDKTAQIWNFETGENIKIIEHKKGVNKVLFSHNGKLVITASSDGKVKVINLDTKEDYQIQHSNKVLDIAISNDDQRLVTASKNVAKIWNINDIFKHKNRIIKEDNFYKSFSHQFTINKAIFTSNNKHLITVDDAGKGRVWQLDSNNGLSAEIFHNAPIVDVEILNNQTIITASWDNTVRSWKITPNNEIKMTSLPSEFDKFSLISEDEKLAIIDKSNRIKILNTTNNTIVDTGINNEKNIQQIILSSQGNYLGIVDNETVKIWKRSNDNVWKLMANLIHLDVINYLQFSANENYLVTASDDWKTRLWRLKPDIKFNQGKIIFNNHIDSLNFSPDSKFLGIISQNNKGFILNIEQSISQEIISKIISFSPKSNYLITYDNGKICLYDSKLFTPIKCLFSDHIKQIQWSKLEEYFITKNNTNKLTIWQVGNNQRLKTNNFTKLQRISLETEIKNFKISPYGNYLAILKKNNQIEIRSIFQPSTILLEIQSNDEIKEIKLDKNSLLTVITVKDMLKFPLWYRHIFLTEKTCDLLTHNLTSRQWTNWFDQQYYRPTCVEK
ncbi:MAG: AAA-like domain-containing protein [Crocosphaera sp.]|nr:AAA-like domain-containing protein [Crocosphaera sp.]